MYDDMLSTAIAMRNANLSVIPITTDGRKAPHVGPNTGYKWGPYQEEIASEEQICAWFDDNHPGIGVVCGAVSGNLELLEFEGRATGLVEDFRELVDKDHPGLLDRILNGYIQQSPSGGLHLLYRIKDGAVEGNKKLAQREAYNEELTEQETDLLETTGKRARRVLIETRGEHGYLVMAPSHGSVHESGKPWTVLNGSVDTIAEITAEERDALHIAASAFDEIPQASFVADTYTRPDGWQEGDLAPGEDFNQRATWTEILEPHGWTLVRQDAVRSYWCRPGKRHGISAVCGGNEGDFFYCWSTSTALPSEQSMSKWRVYTFLNHGGDFTAAARELGGLGYGTPLREPKMSTSDANDWALLTNRSAEQLEEAISEEVARIEQETMRRSDDGNAEELIKAHGHEIRYCEERGRWLIWTGQVWRWEKEASTVRRFIKIIARGYPEEDKADQQHKKYSLSARGIAACLDVAKTVSGIGVKLSDLDNQPLELNTPDGIIDLTTGQVAEHDPSHLHTKITECGPDFAGLAKKNLWTEFLAQTFAGSRDDVIGFMRRMSGYSATGMIGKHILPFCYGTGGNGKGVFLETIQRVLGDYAGTAPNGFLMAQTYAKHETEIARLFGMRMVICSEVNQSDRFDEARVKQLTGGDTLTARYMNQDYFDFTPSHKLWLMGNHQPAVDSGGTSFWRRVKLIEFGNTVDEKDMIDDLQGKLVRDCGRIVMAWIVAGAVEYFKEGLQIPESIQERTENYEHDEDSIGRFIEDCCVIEDTTTINTPTSVLRLEYESYCAQNGLKPLTANSFSRTLKARYNLRSGRTSRDRFFYGIKVHVDRGDAFVTH